MHTPNGRVEIVQLFGQPARPDGTLDPRWFAECVTLAKPLEPWELWYQNETIDRMPFLERTPGVRLHRLVIPSWLEIMSTLWRVAAYGSSSDDVTRGNLKRWGWSITGGGFNFRPTRGDTKLSLHGWGIAEDRDPLRNPRGRPLHCNFSDQWFEIWQSHGWSDGRHFLECDPMHVQFATGA